MKILKSALFSGIAIAGSGVLFSEGLFCRSHVGQSSTEIVFLPSAWIFPWQYHSTDVSYSFICHKRNVTCVVDRVIKLSTCLYFSYILTGHYLNTAVAKRFYFRVTSGFEK